MLGWELIVARRIRDHVRDPESPPPVIARWTAGIEGIDWLVAMVANGTATGDVGNGYPGRFYLRAGDLAEALSKGFPNPLSSEIIISEESIPLSDQAENDSALSTLRSLVVFDELEIEVWDQS